MSPLSVSPSLQMMEDTRSDFTMTFRQLSEASAEQLLNRDFAQVTITFNVD